jgi:nitrate reductase gamma subunit
MPFAQLGFYGAAVFFVVAVVWRSVRYARAPVHLRWELYPVAHERGRAGYGGSAFEEPDWWRQERHPDHAAAARAMAAEVLLLAGVRHHNPGLWRRSWPFHLGLYLLIVWLVLLAAWGLAALLGVTSDEPLARVLSLAVCVIGFPGLVLGLVGGVALVARRLVDPGLRAYNAPSDFLNLGVFIAWMGVALVVHAAEGGFESLRGVSAALLAGARAPLTPVLSVELMLGAAILVWLPLSRMFHFVAKYFLYHRVRWEDAPNPRGGPLEQRLQQAMNYGVGWSGAHVAGARTWGEAAAGPRKEQP